MFVASQSSALSGEYLLSLIAGRRRSPHGTALFFCQGSENLARFPERGREIHVVLVRTADRRRARPLSTRSGPINFGHPGIVNHLPGPTQRSLMAGPRVGLIVGYDHACRSGVVRGFRRQGATRPEDLERWTEVAVRAAQRAIRYAGLLTVVGVIALAVAVAALDGIGLAGEG
jgi:hypothetical protein